MKPLIEQFQALSNAYPGVTLNAGAGAVHLVHVPVFDLPVGWSQSQTQVRFVVPNGYPYARPDCFWADLTLRLLSGQVPKNAQINQSFPGDPNLPLLWFSWHVAPELWNPSASNLSTYMQVIRRRFEELQ